MGFNSKNDKGVSIETLQMLIDLVRTHGKEFLLKNGRRFQILRSGKTFRNGRTKHLGVLLSRHHGNVQGFGNRCHVLSRTNNGFAAINEWSEAFLNVHQQHGGGFGTQFSNGAFGDGY